MYAQCASRNKEKRTQYPARLEPREWDWETILARDSQVHDTSSMLDGSVCDTVRAAGISAYDQFRDAHITAQHGHRPLSQSKG